MAFLLGTETERTTAKLQEEARKLELGSYNYEVEQHQGIWIVHARPSQFLEVSNVTLDQEIQHRIWIVVDGHIQGDSHQAQPDGISGPEKVLKAIRSLGTVKGLRSLAGSFVALVAFPEAQRFILIRDKLGARTGFFAKRQRFVAVSSQSHLLAQLSAFGKQPNASFLAWTFTLRNELPPGHCAFKDIHELKPGECREIGPNHETSYVRIIDQSFDPVPKSESEWVDRFEDVIRNAVRRSFDDSETPCVMLSGGLDSGPAAALAAEKLNASDHRLGAVSWRLKSFPECDESVYVAELAEHIGAKLITFDADELLPFSQLDSSLVQPDTPNPNFYRPLILRCYELARENNYDVILNGNAGDLLYMNWRWLMIDQVRRLEIHQAFQLLRQGISTHGLRNILQFIPLRMLVRRVLRGRETENDPVPPWLTDRALAELPRIEMRPEALRHSFPKYAQYFLGTQIGSGTAYEATLAGRYDLDRRDPFVDEEIVEMCLSMPFSMSYREGRRKWIMREAMKQRGYLPESFRIKPRTGILTAFLDAGFDANSAMISDFLFREHTEWQEWIEPAPVLRALSDHQQSYKDRALAAVAIGYCLWLEKIKRFPTLDVSCRNQ